jgi:hypothetical protein
MIHACRAVAGSASARLQNEAVCGCETWRPSVPARERRCDEAIPAATTEPAPLVPSAAAGLGLAALIARCRQASMPPLVGNLQFCRAARGAGGEHQFAHAVD